MPPIVDRKLLFCRGKYLARNRGGCKFFSDFDIKAVLKRRKARRDMDSAVSWRLSGEKLPEKKRTLPDDLRSYTALLAPIRGVQGRVIEGFGHGFMGLNMYSLHKLHTYRMIGKGRGRNAG